MSGQAAEDDCAELARELAEHGASTPLQVATAVVRWLCPGADGKLICMKAEAARLRYWSYRKGMHGYHRVGMANLFAAVALNPLFASACTQRRLATLMFAGMPNDDDEAAAAAIVEWANHGNRREEAATVDDVHRLGHELERLEAHPMALFAKLGAR